MKFLDKEKQDNFFKKLGKFIVEIFFPNKCLLCGKIFSFSEELSDNSILCAKCSESIDRIKLQRGCRCIKKQAAFRQARACGDYENGLRELIISLKFKRKLQTAAYLGDILFCLFSEWWNPDKVDVIIPVPLHIKRFRKRGFNQAYLFIKDWDARIGKKIVCRDILVRVKSTKPQTGLEKVKRLENIKNAFEVVRDAEKIREKNVVLVDDVFTTGATAHACARTLIRAGAKNVDVLTIARA